MSSDKTESRGVMWAFPGRDGVGPDVIEEFVAYDYETTGLKGSES